MLSVSMWSKFRSFKKLRQSLILSLGMLTPYGAFACPDIAGIPDFNCDQSLQIAVIGDSLVFGVGDASHHNRGGYVLRTQNKLKQVIFQNLGVAGLRTAELEKLLVDTFDKNKKKSWKLVLQSADIIILDLGRNDRWLFGTPNNTFKALKSISDRIRKNVKKLTGIEPMVVIATNMLPNRGSQGPWVKELDNLINNYNAKVKIPSLRFDLVSKRLLSSDQIHPTSKGYDALSKTLLSYLRSPLPKRMKALRPDADHDGIADIIEKVKFKTNSTLADTDGDGKSDYQEIFELFTDPLVAD